MRITFAFIALLMLSACTFKSNRGVHDLNIVCSTTNLLRMKSIEITNEFTKVKFGVDSTVECGAYPPGHQNAMFIKDAATESKYKLVNIEGIAIRPNGGHTSEFVLTFEPLPKDLFKIHLVEGNLATQGAWTFMNVTIPSN